MRSWGKLVRILLPAALFLGAMALSAGNLTTLKIAVKTLSGKPIDRADVILHWNANPKHPRSSFGRKVRTQFEVRSNQEGMANFPSVPQGSIRIQIIAKGYQTFGQVYDIDEEEKTIEVKMNPPQQQYTSH